MASHEDETENKVAEISHTLLLQDHMNPDTDPTSTAQST
jgi:hypothetical protein